MFSVTTRRNLTKIGGPNGFLSPSGKRVASIRDILLHPATNEHRHSTALTILDVATGKPVADIRDSQKEPVAWRGDGDAIAAAEGKRHQLGIWDIKTGRRIGKVVSHYDKVTHAAFLDNHIVTMSRDGTLRITDVATSKTISKLEVEGVPRLLSVSSHGQIVSVWSNTVYIWYPGTNQVTSYKLPMVREIEGWPLDVSRDGRYMVCRTEDGFDVMDVNSGETVFENTNGMITAAAFGERYLVTGKENGVEVWDF